MTVTFSIRDLAGGNHFRSLVIGLIAFLTLVDLFAAQAILPSLVVAYGVSPAEMGVAVNASTLGMAIAGLVVSLISRKLNRRNGIWISLVLLSVPTTLLAAAPDLTSFALLRILQGVFMATAFSLTMAYLAEQCSGEDTARALAAYITGVVASNLVGRLLSASVADVFGLASNFYVFALLNLSGAGLVYVSLSRTTPMEVVDSLPRSPLASWVLHLSDIRLRASFGIGFLILFAFIGTFTYVNFTLVSQPLGLSAMSLGFVYLVFIPSMMTTPFAGRAALRFGTRESFWCAIAVALLGLPFLLVSNLAAVMTGLALIGVGTFFAQAIATGYVGRTATRDRAAASGLYLSSYYLGGLAGAFLLGLVFDHLGWTVCVIGIGLSLALAMLLGVNLGKKAEGAVATRTA